MPRKPEPQLVGDGAYFLEVRVEASQQVWWIVSSGAPESSSWPAGSSVTERVVARQRDDAAGCPGCSSTGASRSASGP